MSVNLFKQIDFFGKFSDVPAKRCIPFAGRPVITRYICILSKELDQPTRMEAETMKLDLKGPKQGEEHPKEGPATANGASQPCQECLSIDAEVRLLDFHCVVEGDHKRCALVLGLLNEYCLVDI